MEQKQPQLRGWKTLVNKVSPQKAHRARSPCCEATIPALPITCQAQEQAHVPAEE